LISTKNLTFWAIEQAVEIKQLSTAEQRALVKFSQEKDALRHKMDLLINGKVKYKNIRGKLPLLAKFL